MRRKCISTLLILATIFGLGTKVHLEDFLYKEKDNVTLYIEESKNEKVGNNIENIVHISLKRRSRFVSTERLFHFFRKKGIKVSVCLIAIRFNTLVN